MTRMITPATSVLAVDLEDAGSVAIVRKASVRPNKAKRAPPVRLAQPTNVSHGLPNPKDAPLELQSHSHARMTLAGDSREAPNSRTTGVRASPHD